MFREGIEYVVYDDTLRFCGNFKSRLSEKHLDVCSSKEIKRIIFHSDTYDCSIDALSDLENIETIHFIFLTNFFDYKEDFHMTKLDLEIFDIYHEEKKNWREYFCDFNKPITKYPKNIKNLVINFTQYDYEIVLPPSIEKFVVNIRIPSFPLKNLPENLKDFFLSNYNDKILELPPNLVELRIDYSCCDILVLPVSLKRMEFFYLEGEIGDLPDGLETLMVIGNTEIFRKYPKSLIKLKIHYSNWLMENLSENLQKLTIYDISEANNVNFDNLPQNLTKLRLFGRTRSNFDNLPCTLKFLDMSGLHLIDDQPLDFLPYGLEILKLPENKYNTPVHNLPGNLKKLFLGNDFKQEMQNLPTGLEKLFVKNPKIKGDLPETTEIIYENIF